MNNSHRPLKKNRDTMRKKAKNSTSRMVCPVIFGFDLTGHAKLIYCGKWSCPKCAPRLAKRWAVRVRVHIKIEEERTTYQWFMLTLTLGSKHKDVASAYKGLRKLWNRLRMAITRDHPGDKWQYVAFVEGQPHRQSMPHFHIIMDVQPPAKRNKKGVITEHNLHDWAHRMGWGFYVKLKPVKSDKAASYVAKYVTKGSGVVPKGFRRVRVSRGWSPLPKDPNKRLIVIDKSESLSAYIDRVATETHVDHETIYDRYVDARRALEEQNLDNPD